jgi:hypothetical protein
MNANDILSARAILQGQLAARQRGPDKRLVELQAALAKAQSDEAQAAAAYEAAKLPSKAFSIGRKHRAEELWTKVSVVLSEAQAQLEAHRATLPNGADIARAQAIAQREVLLEESAELCDEIEADFRTLLRNVGMLKGLHQHLVSRFHATGDITHAQAAETVLNAVIGKTSINIQQFLFGLVPHEELASARQAVEVHAARLLQKPQARLVDFL